MTEVTGQGGKAGSRSGLDERGRSAKTAQGIKGDGKMDNAAPHLTYHIEGALQCLRHTDPRITSVARPDLQPCTCDRTCTECGKTDRPRHFIMGSSLCVECRNKRTAQVAVTAHVKTERCPECGNGGTYPEPCGACGRLARDPFEAPRR